MTKEIDKNKNRIEINVNLEKINIMFSNVDVLTSEKLDELIHRLDKMSCKPNIIALQEVKPKNFRYHREIVEYTNAILLILVLEEDY